MPVPNGVEDWREDRARLAATETFVLAVIGGYIPRSVWALVAKNLRLEAVATKALCEAGIARRIAEGMMAEIRDYKSLLKSLEERIDNLIPGVKEPT